MLSSFTLATLLEMLIGLARTSGIVKIPPLTGCKEDLVSGKKKRDAKAPGSEKEIHFHANSIEADKTVT